MTTVLDRTQGTAPSATQRPDTRQRLPRPKPVTVNGVVIPRGDIGRETQHHPAGKPIDAWNGAARALVVRELLLQEARRLNLVPAPLSDADGRRETDEEALVRQLVEQEVITPAPDEATCRRIYDQQVHRFKSSELYAVRHILIAAAPGDAEMRAEALRHAETLIAAIRAAPESFAALASCHSACPSGQQGGALGQISHGQTVPEFEDALAQAPVGTVMPAPVETRYGVHVVVVDQKIDGRQLPFEIVQDRIASWLADRSRDTAIKQYIAMLAGRATITGVELTAPGSAHA